MPDFVPGADSSSCQSFAERCQTAVLCAGSLPEQRSIAAKMQSAEHQAHPEQRSVLLMGMN